MFSNFKFQISNSERGIATLEIIIAMVLIVLAISAVLPLVSSSQSASVDSETNQEALYKAEALLENARVMAALDFNLVNPVAANSESIYQKSVSVEQMDLYTKKVISNVTWNAEGGRKLRVQLSTLLTNAMAVDTSGASTCSSVLTGNWTNAQTTSVSLPGNLNGGTVTGVDAKNGKLYVTTADSPSAGADDFYIYDISQDPKNPTFIKSINTGAGLKGLAVAGDHAYVANTSNKAQFQIINIHDPANPIITTSYKVPGATGLGNSIFYTNKKVYLGLTSASGPEFNMIDVTNPATPVRLGGYTIGQTVNSIFVRNNFAYVTSAGSEALKVFDITAPSNIAYVGGLSEGGNGSTVYGVGDTVYLGTTTTSEKLYVLDNTKLTQTSASNTGSQNIPLLERPGLTSVVTYEQSAGGAAVASRSYARGITNPQLTTKIPGGPTLQKNDFYTGAEFYDFYVSDANGTANPKGAYFTIDVYTPGNKPNIGSGGNIDAVELVFANGTKIYASAVVRTVNGTDLSGDYAATKGYASRALGKPDSLGLSGATFLGNQHASITLGFPAMPTNPIINSIDVGGNGAETVLVRDHLAFVTTGTELKIYDIQDPLNIGQPIQVINLQSQSTNSSADCEGNYLYIGSSNSIIVIYPGT